MVAEVITMREEEKKQASPANLGLRRMLRKRWVFPAIYLASAALILTGVLWFQNKDSSPLTDNEVEYGEDLQGASQNDNPAVPVTEGVERFIMPVLDPNAVEIKKPFYDAQASAEEQEAALVFYNNTYYQNKGVDIAKKDGKTFDVAASLSGTVTKAEKDPIFGHVVHIEHSKGVVTVYQSLADVQVKAGDTVKQGEIIGKAGQNQFNQDAGIHVHFEVRKDGKPVNPLDYFDEPLTVLTEANEQANEQQTEQAGEENKQSQKNQTEQSQTEQSQSEQGQTEQNQTEQNKKTNETNTQTEQHSEHEGSSNKTPDASIGMAKA